MESVKLNELGSEDLKEMIATLQERLVIVETRKKTKKMIRLVIIVHVIFVEENIH